VAHDVVRFADQLCLGETRDVEEVLVDVSQPPLQVRLRDDQGGVAEGDFVGRDWQVGTHEETLKAAASMRRRRAVAPMLFV
jgi:hypothetical protein